MLAVPPPDELLELGTPLQVGPDEPEAAIAQLVGQLPEAKAVPLAAKAFGKVSVTGALVRLSAVCAQAFPCQKRKHISPAKTCNFFVLSMFFIIIIPAVLLNRKGPNACAFQRNKKQSCRVSGQAALPYKIRP